MRRRPVILSEEQEQELRHCRDHHPLPYMRLKAAAILKVAAGQTIKQVALTGLNKPVTQECVSVWISRYEQDGLQGLRVQPGRGRKASFPPVHGNDPQNAAAQVQGVCYRSPLLYELPRSRWSLALLQKAIPWLAGKSLSCLSQLLKRLHVSYKRGRRAVHSPDLLYDVKLARIRAAYQQMQQHPTRVVLLYLDEHLVGRYPTVARCYSSTGAPGMQARQYAGYNSMLRIVGCLDAASGAVIAKRYGSVTVDHFLKFLQMVEAQYPDAEVIYIALDNWSVHINERVLPALQARQSKIQLLFQPTYAPWTNPMEKVWLRFNEDVSHMHPHWHKWQPWRLRIDEWIAQVRPASQAMLQATGVASLSYLAPPTITHFNF